MKRIAQPIILTFLLVFLTGCLQPVQQPKQEEEFRGVGLAVALSVPKETPRSLPINILAKVKNMATENATEIYAYLMGLDGWDISQSLQTLDSLLAKDTYTFSWIAYAPNENKTYRPKLEFFYKMKTDAKLIVRIYNNDYLNTLQQSERDAIKNKSALISFTTSSGTPVSVAVNIPQPFVIASDWQDFSFIIDIRNVGGGTVYHPSSNYLLLSVVTANQTAFSATSSYAVSCRAGAVMSLATSRSIVCSIPAKKADVANYIDVSVDIRLEYAYLFSTNSTIMVK